MNSRPSKWPSPLASNEFTNSRSKTYDETSQDDEAMHSAASSSVRACTKSRSEQRGRTSVQLKKCKQTKKNISRSRARHVQICYRSKKKKKHSTKQTHQSPLHCNWFVYHSSSFLARTFFLCRVAMSQITKMLQREVRMDSKNTDSGSMLGLA